MFAGGPTDVDNMVPACWNCHNKIHHFGWQIHGPPGKRTLHPPDPISCGPALAPDPPGLQTPHRQSQSVRATADHGSHHDPESADAGVAVFGTGPAAARAALRGARAVPLFAPD